MRVCLLTRYFEPSYKEGVGIGSMSGQVLDGLRRRGIYPYGVSTKGSGLFSYFLYSFLEIPFRMPRDCDVYHALTPVEALWTPKDKSVVTFNDLFQLTNPEGIGAGMGYNPVKKTIGVKYFEIACRVASRCKKIVCISEKTKREVISILGADERKVRVIRLGVNGSLYPEPKTDKVFRVGYLGMLDKRKRVDLLVKAFKGRNLIGGELVIGGRGLDEALLKEEAQGTDNIHFLGYILPENLNSFYNSLDLFVFPTAMEGYGLPIVEAMACKKPVVVLGDADIPEEVKNRCIIAESLDHLFTNKAYLEGLIRSVDIEGNYQFAKSHSWERCIDEYLEVYKEVLET